jgi:hypothetical protein
LRFAYPEVPQTAITRPVVIATVSSNPEIRGCAAARYHFLAASGLLP